MSTDLAQKPFLTGAISAVRPAPILSLDRVGKSYPTGKGRFAALSEASIEVKPGEIVALMGPSGSGKTTMLSIMGCILRPSGGRVVVAGTDVTELSEDERSQIRLRHIGFVFQSYNLFSTLTARQNVEIALELRGIKGRERGQQAIDTLAELGLADKSDSYPGDLSGGQKQRVAIARALAGWPEIILADEPTAALDGQTGRRIMSLLRGLAVRNDRAVVVVTHDRRLLEFMDRVITIEDGRIVEDAPRFLIEAPLLTAGPASHAELARPGGEREA